MNPEKPGALHLATALVDGLVARGMAGVVMSPGSRNAPLIQAVTRLGIEQAVALDERAAGHHALGMAFIACKLGSVCTLHVSRPVRTSESKERLTPAAKSAMLPATKSGKGSVILFMPIVIDAVAKASSLLCAECTAPLALVEHC